MFLLDSFFGKLHFGKDVILTPGNYMGSLQLSLFSPGFLQRVPCSENFSNDNQKAEF